MPEEYKTKSGVSLVRSKGPSYHTFWLSQNPNKDSEWSKLAGRGHDVRHLMWNKVSGKSGFAGTVSVDGIAYGYDEARQKFL